MTARYADHGAFQIGWLTRLALVVVVLGVLGFDGFAVLSGRIRGEDDAQNAAEAASTVWQRTHNIQAAYQAAEQYAAPKGERILAHGFSVDSSNTVHLLLRRTAKTIVFARIGPLKKYTVETLHGDANSNPP